MEVAGVAVLTEIRTGVEMGAAAVAGAEAGKVGAAAGAVGAQALAPCCGGTLKGGLVSSIHQTAARTSLSTSRVFWMEKTAFARETE